MLILLLILFNFPELLRTTYSGDSKDYYSHEIPYSAYEGEKKSYNPIILRK